MTTDEQALPVAVAEAMRPELPSIAHATVAEIIVEVPSYADAFSGDMGRAIENAVELALAGFLELATVSSGVVTNSASLSTRSRRATRGRAGEGRGTVVVIR